MNSSEIRKIINDRGGLGNSLCNGDRELSLALLEIAAQLADLNRNIQDKELKAQINLYESAEEEKDLA